MKKLLLVFGTRPEAVKMCPLVKAFQQHPDAFQTSVCVTGQHRQMLDQVLAVFDVNPDYDLDIMSPGQNLYDITSRVLTGMNDVLRRAAPDIVFVHGDTTTSFAAALAASYQHIPVAHVEAGLRTYNPLSPWPEELNRQLTARLSCYHFAPTAQAACNLRSEQVQGRIVVTGNTVIDALHIALRRLRGDAALMHRVGGRLAEAGYPLTRLSNGRRMVLITGHRRENFGEGFVRMLTAFKELADTYPQVDFVYPVHLNPNVRRPVAEIFGIDTAQEWRVKAGVHCNLFFINPLEYLEFILLMEHSTLVLTDSGGIQEEAPGLGKPVLVMRDTTERPEAVEAGTVRLVGTDRRTIVAETVRLLTDSACYNQMSHAVNPYGDGHACESIVHAIMQA